MLASNSSVSRPDRATVAVISAQVQIADGKLKVWPNLKR